MMSRKSGIAIIEFVIAIILLLIVGLAIFVAINHHPNINPKPKPTPTSSPASPSPSGLTYTGPTNFTGIYGTVGSTGCPAEQVNHPCPITAVAGMEVSAVSAIAQNTNSFKATTDSSGSFQLSLPPGTYSLSARQTGRNALPLCKQSTSPVTVKSGTATRYDFVCENGIE